MYSLEEVRTVDPEIADLIVKEQERQNSHIELIASENIASPAVIAAPIATCSAQAPWMEYTFTPVKIRPLLHKTAHPTVCKNSFGS